MSLGDFARRRALSVVMPRLDRVGRAVGLELGTRLIRRTPIDTGRARGNWHASIDREDPSVAEDRREHEALREGAIVCQQLSLSREQSLYWTNAVPYIGRLNDGWSQQAPRAFVQITVQEMQRYVDRVARLENLRG